MWRKNLSIFLLNGNIFAFTCLAAVSVQSAGASEFYEQCERLFPSADAFATDCLEKARPFGRTFYPGGGTRGEPERFATYFAPLPQPSRFLLGCVLNFEHKIRFAGMYYSHEPLDMKAFSSYPIKFVDFDGNVGLDVEGKRQTLIAVRPFMKKNIPEMIVVERHNCEKQNMELMADESATTKYGARYRYTASNFMEKLYSDGDIIPGNKVRRFLGIHHQPLIYVDALSMYFVDAAGVLMLSENSMSKLCAIPEREVAGVLNIFFEMCSETPDP